MTWGEPRSSTRVDALSERLGDLEGARFVKTNLIYVDVFRGRWDAAMEALDEFIAACEAGASHTNESSMRGLRGSVRRARGDEAGAVADHRRPSSSRASRATQASRLVVDDLRHHARGSRGKLERARALADEAIPIIRETGHARGGAAADPLPRSARYSGTHLLQALDANPLRRDIVGIRDAARPEGRPSVRRRARLADRQSLDGGRPASQRRHGSSSASRTPKARPS